MCVVWKGRIPLTDCQGSLTIGVLPTASAGANDEDAVSLQPREAGQEDVKTGAQLSPDILRSNVARTGVTTAGSLSQSRLLLWVHS